MPTTETRAAGYVPSPYVRDADETVTCPGCGRGDDTDANFCDQCDYPLTATTQYGADPDDTVTCPSCDKMNDPDAHFCDQCGIRLEGRPDVKVGTPVAEPAEDGAQSEQVSMPSDHPLTKFTSQSVPRDNQVRDLRLRTELRADTNGNVTELTGIFSQYGVFYEIDSWYEGNFLERTAPGCFTDTIRDDIEQMRCLYDHGFDVTMGNKPIGPIRSIVDTPEGPEYHVPFANTDYNRDWLIPVLRGELLSGETVGSLLGSSMRFDVVEDSWVYPSVPTAENPRCLPERTIIRAKVMEFGPVTFPANAGATAYARSSSDDWFERLWEDQSAFKRYSERVGTRMAQSLRERVPKEIIERKTQRLAEARRKALRTRAKALLAV